MAKLKGVGTGRPGRRAKLIAMATMAACTIMGHRDAKAQQAPSVSGKQPSATQLPVKRFRIAAGPLDAALELYRQQSGVAVKVEIPAEKLAGFTTPGVTGLYGNDSALRQLLAGTGLSFTFAGADAVSVGLRDTQLVQVTSGLPDSVTMSKFTEPLLDTPQTVVEIPPFVLKDEQNRTLLDAVRNVPGISIAAGESGAQGDNLTIRGFTARNDIFLDGIRDFGSYYRDSFNYEQVEVLEGPAGVQFGRGSTGGVINQESKIPAADKFVQRADAVRHRPDAAHYGGHQRAAAGCRLRGRRFRLNAMATEGGVAGRPYAENRRFGVAPSHHLRDELAQRG